MLQSNFTQVATSFDMGTLKLSQFLQNKSPPSKIHQVLGNSLLLDPRWPRRLGALPLTPVLLSIATTLKLYESAQN